MRLEHLWYAVVVAAIAFALVAPGLALLPRRLLRALGAYYAIAYLGRGSFLLVFEPLPGTGTFIADRLLRRPTYADGLAGLAPIAAIGLGTLVLATYATCRVLQARVSTARGAVDIRAWRQAAIVAAVVCWAARAVAFLAGDPRAGGVIGRLTVVPTVMLGIVVLATPWRRNVPTRVAVYVLLVGEALWSVQTLTKTPLLAAVAFLYLDPNRRRLSWKAVAVVVAVVALAFGFVQPNKTDLSVRDYSGKSWLTPAARVLVRFDLVRSLTVARERGPGAYLERGEFADRVVDAWIPTVVADEKTPSGVLWGQRVNGSTSGASLADGPTAEGYVLHGVPGVLLWCLLAGMIIGATAIVLSRPPHFFAAVVALYLVASNAMFERGLLGLNEALSAAVQIAVVVALPYFVARHVRARGEQRGVVTIAARRRTTPRSPALPH